jgi:hypothetical protein
VHACFSTNSAGSGQDYPGAASMIFLFIAKFRAVLTGRHIFASKKKALIL